MAVDINWSFLHLRTRHLATFCWLSRSDRRPCRCPKWKKPTTNKKKNKEEEEEEEKIDSFTDLVGGRLEVCDVKLTEIKASRGRPTAERGRCRARDAKGRRRRRWRRRYRRAVR